MEQHPIPQNVTQYQFRLIGNMTLKQFAMLGVCILCAFLFSKAEIIPPIFRYPIIMLLVSLGLALAFLPFEERSLDVWLINFIKSVYGPTQYLWRASGELPPYLLFNAKTGDLPKHPMLTPGKSHLIQPYLQSMQQKPQNSIDKIEQNKVNNITSLFNSPPTNTPSMIRLQNPIVPKQNIQNQERIQPKPPQKIIPIQNQAPPLPTTTTNNMTTMTQQQQSPTITSAPPIGTPLKIKSLRPEAQKPTKPEVPAILFTEDQMPPIPDVPNTVVGAIMAPNGQLISNAIIEIRDATGMPIRAIKSNRLGQFFVATPLRDGSYTMIIEHDTFSFDTISLVANSNIISPLKIVSKSN